MLPSGHKLLQLLASPTQQTNYLKIVNANASYTFIDHSYIPYMISSWQIVYIYSGDLATYMTIIIKHNSMYTKQFRFTHQQFTNNSAKLVPQSTVSTVICNNLHYVHHIATCNAMNDSFWIWKNHRRQPVLTLHSHAILDGLLVILAGQIEQVANGDALIALENRWLLRLLHLIVLLDLLRPQNVSHWHNLQNSKWEPTEGCQSHAVHKYSSSVRKSRWKVGWGKEKCGAI